MTDGATSIESLMKKKTPQNPAQNPPRQQQQQRQQQQRQQAPKIKNKYAPPHVPSQVENYNNTPNPNESSFTQITPEPDKQLSFFEKIKQDKYTMDLISVAGIVFLITNNSISSMIKSKFPSAYKEGVITLQGNFLLACLSVIALIIVRKLI